MAYPALSDALDTGPYTGSLGAEGHSNLHNEVALAIQEVVTELGDDLLDTGGRNYADLEAHLDDLVHATGGGRETLSIVGNVSGSTAINLANGNMFDVTLTGNTTFTFTNADSSAATGGSFSMLVRQDGSGGRTITWSDVDRWTVATPAPVTTASSLHLYVFEFWWSASTLVIGSYVGQCV